MKTLVSLVTALVLLGAAGAAAQAPPPGALGERRPFGGRQAPGEAWAQSPPPAGRGERQPRADGPGGPGLGRAMEENFFPAELVMRNQRAIGLREDQQEAIRAEMQKSMARFTDLQWQQSAQVETLEAMAGKQPVDEKAVLAHFDKLLALETELKRLHFATLIRIRNILTPEQQAQLREQARQGRPRPEDPQRRPGGNQAPPGMAPPGAPGR